MRSMRCEYMVDVDLLLSESLEKVRPVHSCVSSLFRSVLERWTYRGESLLLPPSTSFKLV